VCREEERMFTAENPSSIPSSFIIPSSVADSGAGAFLQRDPDPNKKIFELKMLEFFVN
jgi:hypothetical protein